MRIGLFRKGGKAAQGRFAFGTVLIAAFWTGMALTGQACAKPDTKPTAPPLPDRTQVLQTLQTANLAQMAAMRNTPLSLVNVYEVRGISSNWVAATYYIGASRLAALTGDPGTLQFLSQVSEHFTFGLRGGDTPERLRDADNIAIGDLYEDQYSRSGEAGMLLGLRTRLDAILPALTEKPAPAKNVWWWCDALFMAPPVLARMSAITGDAKYRDAMDMQWWRVYDRLYDKDEHLYYRDDRFVGMRSENGRKVFWSRGNGWVMAGTARVLNALPADYPTRPRYITLFREMAAKIVTLQQADGLWRSSLEDPQAFDMAETSGTAFYVYALAWGIHHGILERDRYLPAVLKGWAGLNAHLLPSGLLGAVQTTGDRPRATAADEVGLYGQGAFLLAGIEVMALSQPVRALPEGEPPRLTAIPPPSPTANGRQGVRMPTMAFALSPPPADQRGARASVAYAPQRYDDILWENDLTAHRIYGPALEAYEPPSGSGIDAWGKTVPYPFMERQLATGDQHGFHGEGLDFYDVGQSRGMGGLGIWDDNALWVSRNYKTYKILKNGPEEAKFTVHYAPWPVGVKRKVWETRTFSLPRGTHFTRMVSTIGSDSKAPLIVGIGISRHATSSKPAEYQWDAQSGRLTVWEQTDADKGTMGTALMVNPAMVTGFTKDATNLLVLVKVTPGIPFVYYGGAAWDKSPDIATKGDWTAYIAAQKPDFDAKH